MAIVLFLLIRIKISKLRIIIMYKCFSLIYIAFARQKSKAVFLLFSLCFIFFSFSTSVEAQSTDEFVVLIDPGHGGRDSGTRGGGYFEKHVVLRVAKEVAGQLEQEPSIKAVLTRDSDVFIPLDERADMGNEMNADLFVSIHCNASVDDRAYGAETFVLGIHRNKDNLEVAKKENKVILMEDDYKAKYNGFDPESPESYMTFTMMQEEYLDESILLADKVQKRFKNQLNRYNRGVKQAGFLVLRETTMPSILIELGFLSNPREGKFLNSTKGQQKMARGVVAAVKAYRNSVKSMSLEEQQEAVAKSQAVAKNSEKLKKNNTSPFTFKVQLAASSNQIAAESKNFNGLQPITKGKEGGYFKYYYGYAAKYESAKELVKNAQNKGYDTAFVVAFSPSGEKISVAKAINSSVD